MVITGIPVCMLIKEKELLISAEMKRLCYRMGHRIYELTNIYCCQNVKIQFCRIIMQPNALKSVKRFFDTSIII